MKIHAACSFDQCITYMCAHASKTVPFECCGLVLSEAAFFASDKYVVCECTNIQNALNQKNPIEYERDATKAYFIDPSEQREVHRIARQSSLIVSGIYHSHIEHAVYFSAEDRQGALWFDEPVLPHVSHVVISIIKGSVRELGFFEWDDSQSDFYLRKLIQMG